MKKYFILAAAVIAMASCSNDEGANVANDGTIRIATDLGKGGTRTIDQTVQATQIANGGKVFVSFTTTETPDQGNDSGAAGNGQWVSGTPNTASAVYTADGSGNLSTSKPTLWPLSTPGTTETVSLEAWAPVESNATAKPTTFTVQGDQTSEANYVASDFLYGKRVAFTNNDIKTPVLVKFDHMLAKINVNVSAADGSSVTGAKVEFGNANIKRSADVGSNGAVTGTEITKGAITMASALDANATASCIIIPQDVAKDAVLFTVTLGDKIFTCTASAAKTFSPTKVYTYNLSLSDGKTIVLSEQINDWTPATATPESVIAKQ